MINVIYGPPHLHHHRRIGERLGAALRVSEYWPGHLRGPGPYDMMVIATLLLKMGGKEIEGKLGSTAPFWDLVLEGNTIKGKPLAEGQKLTPQGEQLMKDLWAQRKSLQVSAVIFEDVQAWHQSIYLGKFFPSVDLARAARDRLVTDTIYWLAKTGPVMLIANAEWVGENKDRRLPILPPDVAALADNVYYMEDPETMLLESSRFREGEGEVLTVSDMFKKQGLLAERSV